VPIVVVPMQVTSSSQVVKAWTSRRVSIKLKIRFKIKLGFKTVVLIVLSMNKLILIRIIEG